MGKKSTGAIRICLFLFVRAIFAPLAISHADNKPYYIEFIMDASGRMSEKIDGNKKIDIARTFLYELVKEISLRDNGNCKIALRVFGRKKLRPEACQDSTLDIPFIAPAPYLVLDTLKTIFPHGEAPLAYNLQQASLDFPEDASRKTIILITDSMETCGGDPYSVVREIRMKKNVNTLVHVIGFNINPKVEKQLSRIAEVGGGIYALAKSTDEFKTALNSIMAKTFLNPNLTAEISSVTTGDAGTLLNTYKKKIYPEVSPTQATIYASFIPGWIYFKTGEKSIGSGIIGIEALCLGLGIGIEDTITNETDYNEYNQAGLIKKVPKKKDPTEAETEFINGLFFSAETIHFSQAIGAGIRIWNSTHNNDLIKKDPIKTALMSSVLPGSGYLYVGDFPELGLTITGYEGFFIYQSFNDFSYDFTFSNNTKLKGENINATIAASLYGLQIIGSYMNAQDHNSMIVKGQISAYKEWKWAILPLQDGIAISFKRYFKG